MTSVASNPILMQCDPRVSAADTRRKMRRHSRRLKDLRRVYKSDLAAEQQAGLLALKAERAAMRMSIFRRRGRRIELLSLLRQRNADKRPVWCVVDPTLEIARGGNGQHDTDGTFGWPCHKGSTWIKYCTPAQADKRGFVPVGMPALPPVVREIIASPMVRRHANRVGVLYQPQEWREVSPDPALVVEWLDEPGVYYALAVWGGDRAGIMEFVS